MVPLNVEGFDLLLYVNERGKLFRGEAKLIVFLNVRDFLLLLDAEDFVVCIVVDAEEEDQLLDVEEEDDLLEDSFAPRWRSNDKLLSTGG